MTSVCCHTKVIGRKRAVTRRSTLAQMMDGAFSRRSVDVTAKTGADGSGEMGSSKSAFQSVNVPGMSRSTGAGPKLPLARLGTMGRRLKFDSTIPDWRKTMRKDGPFLSSSRTKLYQSWIDFRIPFTHWVSDLLTYCAFHMDSTYLTLS